MSKDLFNLTGKVALVTGASSGLGVQFAKALAGQGANVAIVARRLERLEATKQEIADEFGVDVLALSCDVLDVERIKEVVAAVKERFGRVDILVNNAGTARAAAADEQSDEDWKAVIDTNLNAVYYVAREVGKVMKEQQYGKIINIGSIHSAVAMRGLAISGYCASKGGVLMLTKELANEWAPHGITVNAIGPAYFPSEMTDDVIHDEEFLKLIQLRCPMGRPGKPGELDGALIYFASDASTYTTGQILWIDGGWTAI
ncbi:MAG: SDR family oxidoreductase [Propionibacteriaceae bacterium]|jgi:gluconate 5-dehydrogenase|nr:SDR family oxidoreductase [Propionibacteriaceae bacterium]